VVRSLLSFWRFVIPHKAGSRQGKHRPETPMLVPFVSIDMLSKVGNAG
jgi:hypothetical protein